MKLSTKLTAGSNIHFRTAYLEWRESCCSDLNVRFRESYACDLNDRFGGSFGRVVLNIVHLIKIYRITGYPFRKALKRYFKAIECIRRVALAYFDRSRALQATYMDWWKAAEKQWREDDQQKRINRKGLPIAGTAAADRYKWLGEHISLNADDDVRREALGIHMRTLKFDFMKKYSVWLKQYRVYNAELKRRRREVMLLRHSATKQRNDANNSNSTGKPSSWKLEDDLKAYRMEFIQHIMTKPTIKLNPKTEKLETLYDAVEIVQASRTKERERQVREEFERQKLEKLNKAKAMQISNNNKIFANSSSNSKNNNNNNSNNRLQGCESEDIFKNEHSHNNGDALTPIVVHSPKLHGQSINNNAQTKTATPSAIKTIGTLDGVVATNNNSFEKTFSSSSPPVSPLSLDATRKPQQQQCHQSFSNQSGRDIFAKMSTMAASSKPIFGTTMDHSLKSLRIPNDELLASIGLGDAGKNVSLMDWVMPSSKKKKSDKITSSPSFLDGDEKSKNYFARSVSPSGLLQRQPSPTDCSRPPPLPPPPVANRRRKSEKKKKPNDYADNSNEASVLLVSTAKHRTKNSYDDDDDSDGDYADATSMNQITPSARDSVLKRIYKKAPPEKFSPFQAFGARTTNHNIILPIHHGQSGEHGNDYNNNNHEENNKDNNNSAHHHHQQQHNNTRTRIDDSAYEANVNRIYVPQSCPFKILDERGLSEIDLSCQRVQRDAARRAVLNAKHLRNEEEFLRRIELEEARRRLIDAKRGAGISEKGIQQFNNNNNNNNKDMSSPQPTTSDPNQQHQRQKQTTFLLAQQNELKNKNSAPLVGMLPSEISSSMIKLKLLDNKKNNLLAHVTKESSAIVQYMDSPTKFHLQQKLQEEIQQNKSKFNFSPFSHSRFSAKQYRSKSKSLPQMRQDDDDDDDDDAEIEDRYRQENINQHSNMTQDMLSNAVATGSAWLPARVIVQRSDDGRRLVTAPGAVQPHHADLASTKALSSTVLVHDYNNNHHFSKHQPEPMLASPLHQNSEQRQSSESVFNYLLRTGVPAPTVEKMKTTNQLKARELKPISPSRTQSVNNYNNNITNGYYSHQNNESGFTLTLGMSPQRNSNNGNYSPSSFATGGSSPSPAVPFGSTKNHQNAHINASNVMRSIESVLSNNHASRGGGGDVQRLRLQEQVPYYQRRSLLDLASSPTRASPSLRPQDDGGKKYYGSLTPQPIMRIGQANSMKREFDVTSMSRTPAPYLQ